MSLLEQWLNTFGGGANLSPTTPADKVPAASWLEDARNARTAPSVPQLLQPEVKYPNVGSGPRVEGYKPNWVEGQIPDNRSLVPIEEPTRASARGYPTPNVGTGPRYNTTPENVGSGPRVNTAGVPETTGKGMAPPETTKTPKPFDFDWQKPKVKYGSLLGAPAAGLEALLHSENLNTDEFGGEAGEAWLAENRPEGWTSSTMEVEEQVTSNEASDYKEKADAVAIAEGKVKVLTESQASPSLLEEAQAELAAANAITDTDRLGEYESQTNEDLDTVQMQIDTMLRQGGSTPELMSVQLEATGLLEKKAELENKLKDVARIRTQRLVATDADTKKVIELSEEVGEPDLSGTPEGSKGVVEKAADGVVTGLGEGKPLKEMMSAAGDFLGKLFDDKAIQQALIYYTGARLMGYSASGSGMAAGNMLQKNWAAQGKVDSDRATALAKEGAIDYSKTTKWWDPKSSKVVDVYSAANGNYIDPKTNTIKNAKTSGYVSYDSKVHKTSDEQVNELATSINTAADGTLKGLSLDQYDNVEMAKEMFGDGVAVNDLVLQATRRAAAAGRNVNTSAFKLALQNSVKQQIIEVAKNGTKDGEVMLADLIGDVDKNWLKADFLNEGVRPAKFVFGKYKTWSEEGKGVEYDSEFELPRVETSLMIRKVNNIVNDLTQYYDSKHPKMEAKTRKNITQAKTMSELSKIFSNTVMKDKKARGYWAERAENSGSNAFSQWLKSHGGTGGNTHPLDRMGLNNPEVMGKVNNMFADKYPKDKG